MFSRVTPFNPPPTCQSGTHQCAQFDLRILAKHMKYRTLNSAPSFLPPLKLRWHRCGWLGKVVLSITIVVDKNVPMAIVSTPQLRVQVAILLTIHILHVGCGDGLRSLQLSSNLLRSTSILSGLGVCCLGLVRDLRPTETLDRLRDGVKGRGTARRSCVWSGLGWRTIFLAVDWLG